jgi:D-alanyl-D-alanine carboxypeptidase (penicillin-binding protein 5/6)
MTGLRTLQGGTHRRGFDGRVMLHALGMIVLAVVVGLAVLLGALASTVSSPSPPSHALHRVSHQATGPSPYGSAPAPQHVHMASKFPLRSGLLFNLKTGQVLWSHNPNARVPIASLTKMMTALLVVAHTRPSDTALITSRAVHFTGSGMGILPLHKHVLVRTLLYGLLLPSGNDAAIALAQHVAGSLDRFIAMMNARARAMGLTCTHFTTVSGIVDRGNYSCTRDLAVLAHAVLEQPLLAKIVASRSAVEPLPVKTGRAWLYNNNPLLVERYPGTDGVKTGYTHAAGQCLVGAARRGKTWLGIVLLDSGSSTAIEGPQLLNAGFAALAPPRPARGRSRPAHKRRR